MSDLETVGSFGIDVGGWIIIGLLSVMAATAIVLLVILAVRRWPSRPEKLRHKRRTIATWPCPRCDGKFIGKWDKTTQNYVCPNCELQFDCNVAI